MRTLNDYFIMGGNMTAIQTADNASPVCVIPDKGELKEIKSLILVSSRNLVYLINMVDSCKTVSRFTKLLD